MGMAGAGHHGRSDADCGGVTDNLMDLQSIITCPACGHRQSETMPIDACQFFYDCSGCGAVLRPSAGDCCVFCTFGSMRCPPMQEAQNATPTVKVCCPT